MASTNTAKATEPAEKTNKAEVKAPAAVSVYTAKELADAHKTFHTSREIVTVALRLAGKKMATFAEAKDIIEKFKNKEVK